MSTSDLLEPPASEREAEMAKVAQRCLMAALDHSRAQRIALVDEKGEFTDAPVLELPPQALRFFAEMLGMMAQRRPVGRHRRIEFDELRRYQAAQRAQSEDALQRLADLSQDLGLGY